MALQFEIALLIRNTTHFVTWRIRQVTNVFKFVTLWTGLRSLVLQLVGGDAREQRN